MNVLQQLQNWYFSQCNGDWEHQYGVTVGTLDNPGWILTVDLEGTALSGRPFPESRHGIGVQSEPEGNDWIHCYVNDNKFEGRGGPQKLEEMIRVFLSWATNAA